MNAGELLPTLVAAMAGALIGSLVMLLGHGAWLRLFGRWSAPRLARARTALYRGGRDDAVAALSSLPYRLRLRLLGELASSREGHDRDRIADLARAAGITRRAERMAHSRWWWRRLRGASTLALIGADEILVLSLLRDPHPGVRAQAAELAVSRPTATVVNALLENLEDPAALCRCAAQEALLRLGSSAVPALASYLEGGTGDARSAALLVALEMAQPAFTRAAIRLCEDPDPVVRVRTVGLLGAIGTLEGAEALTRRLDDPAAPVRAAAARALGQIGHWPAAPEVAALMRDRSWEVRHAAGLALRGLGSPGALLLRRFREDGNPFASDMARQILDLPATAEAPA